MAYEVERGRVCYSEVLPALQNEINKGVGVEIHLRGENEALQKENSSLSKELTIAKDIIKTDSSSLVLQKEATEIQRKGKNKWKWATFITVGVFILKEVAIAVFSPD